MNLNEFHIQCAKFHDYSDRAIDWFIKSRKYKYGSDEWKVCRIKHKMLNKKAMKHLKSTEEYLNE